MTGHASTIPVTRISQSVGIQSYLNKADREFTFSWDAKSIPHLARFGLFLDGDKLIACYRCPIAARAKPGSFSGEFVRGLWEHDVAELFIYSIKANEYQEFNLSPTGSWWSCHFTGYRQESKKSFRPPAVKIASQSEPAGWSAAIEIPLGELAFPFHSLEELRLNACLIQGDNPKHYLSAVPIKTKEPDFHHFQSFLPLST